MFAWQESVRLELNDRVPGLHAEAPHPPLLLSWHLMLGKTYFWNFAVRVDITQPGRLHNVPPILSTTIWDFLLHRGCAPSEPGGHSTCFDHVSASHLSPQCPTANNLDMLRLCAIMGQLKLHACVTNTSGCWMIFFKTAIPLACLQI